jgi:hypothetical protein
MSRTGFLFNVAVNSKRNKLMIKRGEKITYIDGETKLGKFLKFWILLPTFLIALPFVINFVFYEALESMYLTLRNIDTIKLGDIFLITGVPMVFAITVFIGIMSLLLPKEYKDVLNENL